MAPRAQARGSSRARRAALPRTPAPGPVSIHLAVTHEAAPSTHVEGVRREASATPVIYAARPDPARAGKMADAGLDTRLLHEIHFFMKLTRRFEDRLVNLYRQGKLLGGLYRSLGQEAVSVGAAFALEEGDLMAPLIRDLGALLVRGYTPRECFAQYLGRVTGPTLGRDGVVHMGEIGGRGVVGGMGMLGALIAVLSGSALAFRIMKHDRVCLTFIGDGGTSSTGFHDGLNLAASRRLPLVLVIENNGYAYSTPVERQTRETDFSARGPAYGCPGESVDGNDVLAVHGAVLRAIRRARKGEGPTVVEARTFRMRGHAEHDDASYVPRERFEEWRKRDPIERYETWLIAARLASRAELDAAGARIEAQLDEDVRWAIESPMPDPASALAGVYAEDTPFAPRPYRSASADAASSAAPPEAARAAADPSREADRATPDPSREGSARPGCGAAESPIDRGVPAARAAADSPFERGAHERRTGEER